MLTEELTVSAPGTTPGTTPGITPGTTSGTTPGIKPVTTLGTYPGFPGTFPTPVHSPLTQQAPLYGGSVPYSMRVQAPSEMVAAEQQIVARSDEMRSDEMESEEMRSDEMVAAAQQQEMGEAQQLEMVEGFFVPDQQQLSEDQQPPDSLQHDSASSSPVSVAQQATLGSARAASETEAAPQFDPGSSAISKTTTVRAYADVHPPEPLCTVWTGYANQPPACCTVRT